MSQGTKIKLEKALELVDDIKSELSKFDDLNYDDFIELGSIARKVPMVTDIDFIVMSRLKDSFLSIVSNHKYFEKVRGSDKYFTYRYKDKINFDIRFYHDFQKVSMISHYTGSALFNVALRSIAKRKGFKLNEKGLFNSDNDLMWNASDVVNEITDKYLLNYLGYDYIKPEDRSVNSIDEAFKLLNKYKIKG